MALPLERRQAAPNPLLQGIAIVRSWPWRLLAVLGGTFLLLALALWGYQASARPAAILVDGTTYTLRTHQRLVGEVLEQAGLSLAPGDEVYPALDAPWQPGQAIVIQRPLPVTVRADGRQVQFYGRPRTLLEALVHAGIELHPRDDVYVNSALMPESAYADEVALHTILAQQQAVRHLAAPSPPAQALRIEVVRAMSLYVHDAGLELEMRTTADTVGAALEEAGFLVYRSDRVFPKVDAPTQPALHVYISRATPVSITADGRTYETRTWTETVADLLREEGLTLGPLDRVEPAGETPLQAGTSLRVVRVTTLEPSEQIAIPYQELQEPDPDMELDQYRLRPGEEGLLERVTRIRYEDGQEVAREYLGERVVREPVDQVFYYGTRIVVRTLDTPHGPIEYWRRIRVWATSYFPSTCDKEPGHPLYGITYTGKWATRGIIAVDPRVIRLHTRMYVPGYGFGQAEDIGGAIKGRHIDLCFDDADWGKGLWSTRYVDIYLLTPIPPASQIRWIVP